MHTILLKRFPLQVPSTHYSTSNMNDIDTGEAKTFPPPDSSSVHCRLCAYHATCLSWGGAIIIVECLSQNDNILQVSIRERSRYQIGWFFEEKNLNSFWPPPPLNFGKLCCNFFMMDMVAFMQGCIDPVVSVVVSVVHWNNSSFYQFHVQKALFKIPKSAT